MATIKKITYKAQFGGKGYLDPKMDPVADLAALREKKAADLLPGMVCTVLNDGTDGEPHEYRYVSGTTWERCDKNYATKEWVGQQGFLTAETVYTAGEGIAIDENHVISCTGQGETYTAGENINIDENNVISVTGITVPTNVSELNNDAGYITGYTPGENITIENGVISAQVEAKTYTAGEYIDIDENDVISVTGMPDVSNFVTSADVESQITEKNYVTSAEVETQILEKEYVSSGDVQTFLTENNYATTSEVETIITEKGYVDSADVKTQIEEYDFLVDADLDGLFNSVEYDATAHTIYFYDKNDEEVGTIDTTDFVKDGMIDSVEVRDGKLIITFNTASGKEPIEIPLTDFFDPTMYYTKEEVDNHITAATENMATTAMVETMIADAISAIPTSFKTINNESIIGEGNIEIEGTTYTAGENINIDENNVISVTGITVPTNVSELNNDAGYITEEAIEGKADITSVTEDISTAVADLEDKIPTKVSDLPNDAGYITADTTYTAGESINIDENNVISVTGITIPTSNTAFTNDAGYITEEAIEGKADITSVTEDISTAVADLEDKIPTKVSDLPNDAGYITASTEYTAGENINIDANNVISVTGMPDTSDFVTSADVKSQIEEYDYLTEADLNGLFNSVEYDATAKTITFYDKNNDEVGTIDTTDFVKDGMIDSVEVKDGNLIITFNTASGKEPIVIPLTDFFDPTEYYTKDEVNNAITAATDGMATTGWVESQGYLTEHQTLKTINGSGLTGEGNLVIEGKIYSAGDNIYIDANDEISVTGITIPTSNTAFTNDAGYLVAADIEPKADTTAVTEAIAIATENMATTGWVVSQGYVTSDTTYSAGANINIDANNEISVTGLPTSNTAFTNDAGYLVAADIEPKADTTAVTEAINIATENMATTGWVVSQGYVTADTTYTAGANINIDANNEISATDTTYAAGEFIAIEGANNTIKVTGLTSAVLASALTADVAVGNVAAGTTFPAGTSIEEILIAIFKNNQVEPEHVVLNFSVTGTGADIRDLENNASVTLTVDGSSTTFTYEGSAVTFDVEAEKAYTLTFSGVTGYDTPSALTYTAESAYTRAVSATYEKQAPAQAPWYQYIETDWDKFDEEYYNIFAVDGDDLPTATTFTSQYVLTNFNTIQETLGQVDLNLQTSGDKYVASYAVPSGYQITSWTNAMGTPQNIMEQSATINGISYKIYTLADGSAIANDVYRVTFAVE